MYHFLIKRLRVLIEFCHIVLFFTIHCAQSILMVQTYLFILERVNTLRSLTSVHNKSLPIHVRFFFFLSQVVLETILVDSEEKKQFHLKLADFFLHHCKDEERVIYMVPEELKLAGEKTRLLEFLRKDQRSTNKPGFWKINYYKVIET